MGRLTAIADPPGALARRARARAGVEADRRHRPPLLPYVLRASVATILTSPLIYSLIAPFVLVDLWVSLYQGVCFRARGVNRVHRREFFSIDRHKLPYLNGVEKVNCVYCAYDNGVVAYVREVLARTEQYWCPIRDARPVRQRHERYARFAAYGDAAGYRQALPALRAKLTK